MYYIYTYTHTYLLQFDPYRNRTSMDEKIIDLWRGKERNIYIYIEPYHDMLLCTTYIHIDTHVSFTIYGGERKGVYTYISNSNHTMTRYYILHIYIHTHTYLLQFVERKGKEYIHIYRTRTIP